MSITIEDIVAFRAKVARELPNLDFGRRCVFNNILAGYYDNYDCPLTVAKDDIKILNLEEGEA